MADFDHNTVAPTDYQRGDVARLASYAEREREANCATVTGGKCPAPT